MHLTIPDRDELPAGLLADSLPVERVLYEAEAPVVYLSKTAQGQDLLAYVADESEDGVFTLLAPISKEGIAALENGSLAVREALVSSWLWLHLSDGARGRVWAARMEDVPDLCLPLPGTPLRPEHEAVLRTRALGEQVKLGKMPASVVAFVADATRRAFKTMLDFTSETRGEGRPREEHRALYDLPIQQFAFSSFELSFGPPDEGLFPREEVRRAAEALEAGLAWAGGTGDQPLAANTNEQHAAALRAALILTPPMAGPIAEIHVSGTWIRHGRIRLTRESRRRVRQELRRIDTGEEVVTYQGRIGELDVDNLTFILRDASDGADHRGVFGEDQLDDMLQLLADGGRVAVAGIERQGRLHVAAIAPAKAETSP